MTLVKSKVGFPFVNGVNTKASEKAQAAGELRDCVNFTVNKLGRLDQREGFIRYPRDIPAMGSTSSGTISSAKAMGHLGDEVVMFDGESAYSKTTDDKWVDVGKLLNIRNEVTPVNKDMQATACNASYGVSGNFEYVAWAEQPYNTGGIGSSLAAGSNPRYKYLVRDRHTGATVVPVTTLQSMSTSYVYEGTGSWPFLGSALKIGLTLSPQDEISIGDWVSVTDGAGGTQKTVVVAVASDHVTVGATLAASGVSQVVTVWKSSGQDALYFAPRLRVLCPVGTDDVYIFLQDGLDLKYYYAKTTNGTHTDLEMDPKGTLRTLGRPFPVWDCDWFLSSNSAVTPGDAAIALVHYESEHPYAAGDLHVMLRYYRIQVGGTLVQYASSDHVTGSSGTNYLPSPIRRSTAGTFLTDAAPIWQLFLKTIHDESASGVPTATRNGRIALGLSVTGVKGGAVATHSRVYLFNDEAVHLWNQQIYAAATVGVSESNTLTRAGIGYDATNLYIMAELHSVHAADMAIGRPQDHYIVSSKMRLSDGLHTSADEKALWSNVSVHSDGFVPKGSSTNRCYFWLSASQLDSSLNSILFLADMDGYIHAHGVQGYAPWNTGLEHPHQGGGSSAAAITSRVQRNMACSVVRGTPMRWHDSGSSEFVAGSSMVDLGTKFLNFRHVRPALLRWDMDPERPFRSQESNGLLYIGGGLLWTYDGDRLIENDFLLYPYVVNDGFSTNTSSVLLLAGVYSYYFTFEYRDDNGAIHSSRPAGPVIRTAAVGGATAPLSDQSMEFKVYLSQITNHRFTGESGNPADYAVNVYRTNVDDTRHFLHASLKLSDWGTRFAPTSIRVEYSDSDGTQHSNTDTDVAIWDSVSPAFASSPVSSPIEVTRHKDSLMVSNTENFLYSSLGLSTVTAAMFPQIVGENTSHFGMFGDSIASPITHVASNGPMCVFFTRDDGFVFGGEGPDMFGAGEWSRPEKLAPGQGVRANGFIASIPMGVIYSSQNGIYLVSRDLQVANLGSAVDDYATLAAANDPVVVDAQNEVWIPIKGDSTTQRTILVYNYFAKAWYRHEVGNAAFHPGANTELLTWVNAKDETIIYLADSNGYLYRQKGAADGSLYVDREGIAGTTYSIACSLKTSWLQIPGYGDKARCYRVAVLGTWEGGSSGSPTPATVLTVKTSTNFNNADFDQTFTTSVTAGGVGLESAAAGSSQVVIKPQFQKMESISLEISTLTTSADHSVRGWSLEGLLMEIGKRPDPTRFKLSSTKTIAGS